MSSIVISYSISKCNWILSYWHLTQFHGGSQFSSIHSLCICNNWFYSRSEHIKHMPFQCFISNFCNQATFAFWLFWYSICTCQQKWYVLMKRDCFVWYRTAHRWCSSSNITCRLRFTRKSFIPLRVKMNGEGIDATGETFTAFSISTFQNTLFSCSENATELVHWMLTDNVETMLIKTKKNSLTTFVSCRQFLACSITNWNLFTRIPSKWIFILF